MKGGESEWRRGGREEWEERGRKWRGREERDGVEEGEGKGWSGEGEEKREGPSKGKGGSERGEGMGRTLTFDPDSSLLHCAVNCILYDTLVHATIVAAHIVQLQTSG